MMPTSVTMPGLPQLPNSVWAIETKVDNQRILIAGMVAIDTPPIKGKPTLMLQ
jgi:hypothetical protein